MALDAELADALAHAAEVGAGVVSLLGGHSRRPQGNTVDGTMEE